MITGVASMGRSQKAPVHRDCVFPKATRCHFTRRPFLFVELGAKFSSYKALDA